MDFFSTKNQNLKVSFKEALFTGMPIDNGLYMPSNLPDLSNFFADNSLSFEEISYEISSRFIDNELSNSDILDIAHSAISFKAPNQHIYKNIYCLELFHGPTLAFKDFGARFMARCMEKFINKHDKELNILVATSGDTGSAVANGFYNVEGINVTILYPKGKVSNIQEKQLTTLGGNVYALEVEGTFDDCQRLVKKAFLDSNLKNRINISSANSINIGRLIPQTFYYAHSFMNLNENDSNLIVCVPSGNFGNLTAGIFAKKMGLPISKFIAATNKNDIVPKFLETNNYIPKVSVKTISNAMDVGNPSNIVRIMNLYGTVNKLKEYLYSWSFSDSDTKKYIKNIYSKYNYLLDPHSAIGMLGINKYINDINNQNKNNFIFLGTAHPAKFADIIEPIIKEKVSMPKSLHEVMNKKKESIIIKNNYKEFYDYLIGTFQ